MNIGILGAGFMGKMHAGYYKNMGDVHITGISGRDGKRTAEAAEEAETEAFLDPYDLIDNKEVDAIDVCLPSGIHTQYVIDALKAGKHVFCETPLAYTAEEAEKMSEASKLSGKKLMVALYDRFQSQYKYIYEYITSGEIGSPKAVYTNRRSPPYYSTEDIFLNLLIHDFDYVSWLLGRPDSVYCRGISDHRGFVENAGSILEYSGVSVCLEAGVIMPKSFPFSTSMRIVCEKGSIDLDWHWGENGPVSSVTLYTDAGTPQKLDVADFDPYEAECRYFIESVNGHNDGSILGIESALISVKIAVLARESCRQGGKKLSYI